MRTVRSSKYFIISNETAQDASLSFEALGLLTYCLSMPEDWEFYPKLIWKQGRTGRDKVYSLFNELIDSYHCIRIRKPNPKAKNLPGEITYEIFDDPEDCKERIQQLLQTEKFVEYADTFKECLRHPAFKNAEETDTEETSNTKETPDKVKKEAINDEDSFIFFLPDEKEQEKLEILKKYNLEDSIVSRILKYPLEHIQQSLKAYDQWVEKRGSQPTNIIAPIMKSLVQGWKPSLSPEEIQEAKELEVIKFQEIVNKRKEEIKQLELKWSDSLPFKNSFKTTENYVELRLDGGYCPVSYAEDDVVEIVKKHIEKFKK